MIIKIVDWPFSMTILNINVNIFLNEQKFYYKTFQLFDRDFECY